MSEAKRPARHRASQATPPPIDAESFLFAHAGPALVLDRRGRVLAAAAVIDVLFVGEPNVLGDALLLVGSASLIGLGYNLLRLMTGSRS